MKPETSYDLGTGRASLGLVLDFAWDHGAFTASDAMTAAALTRSTTIQAIDTLVDAHLLEELPNARAAGDYHAGRPARRFRLPPSLGTVIGIDAGDAHLTIAAADLAGTTVAHRRSPLSRSDTAAQRRTTILRELAATLTSAGIERTEVLAICAGVAAPVSRDGVSPPHPERFWQRTNPHLIDALSDWAPSVEIKNDAQLAAAAEGALGEAVGCRDFVALLAGERLGAGVVIDGHLLHGAHGGVGESKVFDYVRGVDSVFGFGRTAEQHARELVDSGNIAPEGPFATMAPGELNARRVLELAAAGDPDAIKVTTALGRSLARIVGVLGSMFDPARVIVCGGIADGIEPVLDSARSLLEQDLHMPPPQLMRSRLGSDVVIKGAVVAALQAARAKALPQEARNRLSATVKP